MSVLMMICLETTTADLFISLYILAHLTLALGVEPSFGLPRSVVVP